MKPALMFLFILLTIILSCATGQEEQEDIDKILEEETKKAATDDAQTMETVTQVTFSSAGEDKDPHIAPDGETLFYSTTSYSKDFDIYRKKVGSSTVIATVLSDGSDERFPAINPASPKMLAFSSNNEGNWNIYMIKDYTINTGEWIRLTELSGDHLHPSFNHDGSLIAFSSNLDGEKWIIRIFDLKTNSFILSEHIEGLLPEFHPTKNILVFQRMRKTGGFLSEIWTCKYERNSLKELTNIFSARNWGAINPTWINNGEQIAFCSAKTEADENGKQKDVIYDIWSINNDGTNLKKHTNHTASDWMPVGYKDTLYFISDRTGAFRIFSLQLSK